MSETKLDLDALEREAEAMRSFSAWRIISRLIARIRELESHSDTRAMGASAVTDSERNGALILAKNCENFAHAIGDMCARGLLRTAADTIRALLAAQPSTAEKKAAWEVLRAPAEHPEALQEWAEAVDSMRCAAQPSEDKRDAEQIDFTLTRGDVAYNPHWGDGRALVEVVDVNWALRAIAVRLAPGGAIVVWPAASLTRDRIAAIAKGE